MINISGEVKVLTGRKQLFTSKEVNTENIKDILESIFPQHLKNSEDIDYLYWYYRGNQPILRRTKKVRKDIKNMTVENHAYEIVEFHTGYTFGPPIQYIQRQREDEIEGEEQLETKRVSKLNELMYLNDKTSKDRELGEWMLIGGVGYRMVLPYKDEYVPLKVDTLDPRYSFVVYSTGFGKEPVLAGTYVVETDEIDTKRRIGLYSKTEYWEVVYSSSLGEYVIVDHKTHTLGGLPIIEYPANPSRLGVFEPVIGMLDAINNVTSNRMDGIEQFIQSIMKFINVDISKDDFLELLDLGAIKVKSNGTDKADVELMTSELNQDQTQTFVDYLYQTVLTITGVPDRRASSGGNTGQALTIGQGWTNAESRAMALEQMFKSSESKFLKVVLNILRGKSIEGFKDLKLSDIDVKFTRNKTDNLLVKTQGLQNMLEAGIHPRIAIATCNLFSDPEEVFMVSSEHLQKWKNRALKEIHPNNKPNPPDVY